MFCQVVSVAICLLAHAVSEAVPSAGLSEASREAAGRKLRAAVGQGRSQTAARTHASLRREDRLRAAASGHQVRSYVVPRHLQERCAASSGGVIHLADFGADPHGREDSTEALQKALSALLAGPGDGHLSSHIKDLSGRTLDLAGGEYLLSAPLVIPAFFGNFRVVGGTLRASETFPADRWMVELGNESCNPDYALSCNEFVVFEDLVLDGGLHAAGCLRIIASMGVTVGPAIFVEGFTKVGLRIDQGHETLVQEAWFAERFWSDIPAGYSSKSIAIQVNGNDHYIVDTIIWQYAHLGVEINGGANLLMGVHAWGCGQPWCSAITGISVTASQNRIIGCYLDYNSLDIVDPTAMVVEDNYFLGTSVKLIARTGVMNGFVFKHNIGAGFEVNGSFTSAFEVVMEDNVGGSTKATAVRQYQCGPRRNFTFDLSSALLLPEIDHFHYSLSWTGTRGVCPSTLPASGLLPQPRVVLEGATASLAFDDEFAGAVFVEARCCGAKRTDAIHPTMVHSVVV